jgi:F-type H+-transporting ATPase subunit delta
VPDAFLNFLMVVIGKRRQRILPAMGQEYRSMLDERMGVLHVKVSLAHEADERAEREIATALTRMLGKRVIPQIGVEPALLGGIVVRYGDRILDASLRRRLAHLRARLLEATLPTAAAQP